MHVRRIFQVARFLLLILLLMLLLAPELYAFSSEDNRLRSLVGLREFDYLVWESDALFNKSRSTLAAGQQYLNEIQRKKVVLDYLSSVREAQLLESKLHQIYSDPDIFDPDVESQSLREELDRTRATIEAQQFLAEAIVQEQIAAVLREQGFELLGRAWPPVLMHVTPLPSLLVVSPRERIEKINQVSLQNGFTTPEMEQLETAVHEELDRSGLVVPLGGIGTYPAMISETSDIKRLVEVAVHEWAHHWLTLRPLGFNYAFDPDLRIMNETVASMVDEELAPLVIDRFYPESRQPQSEQRGGEPAAAALMEFDFQSELADTRIGAEALLRQARIEEAEAYMEERRQVFLENGYRIRKLNQAFFAFYGAYAAEPGGAQGENPIGPMLRQIREYTPTIRAFMETVASITSFVELVDVYERVVPPEDREI